jgi:hypothetical protein
MFAPLKRYTGDPPLARHARVGRVVAVAEPAAVGEDGGAIRAGASLEHRRGMISLAIGPLPGERFARGPPARKMREVLDA